MTFVHDDQGGAAEARERLPNRRPSVIRTITWHEPNGGAIECDVGIGFRMDGRVAEVFASDLKGGSTLRLLLEDACVLVSLALQHGIAPAALAHSMGRQPITESETAPASLIGAVVEALADEGHALDADEAAHLMAEAGGV